MVDIRYKNVETRTQTFLLLLGLLRTWTLAFGGVTAGVTAFSDVAVSSVLLLISVLPFFPCLRDAIDRNVGRSMASIRLVASWIPQVSWV